jgi:hypothetical protein
VVHGVEELFAHAHQRGGAAGREIEPAEKLEPARLTGEMQFASRGSGRRLPPGGDRRVDTAAVVAEGSRQRLEEGDARPGRQFRIVGEYLVGQRHAGGLAAAGQQFLAQLNQIGGAIARRLAALAQEGAAAVGNALQHFAEERGIHSNHCIAPCADFNLPNNRRQS